MFISASEIQQLHIELTEKCNSACPLCLRTNPNGLQPQSYIGNRELSLDDITRFFSTEIKEQLVEVHMCGSYGDPLMAKDCLLISDFFSTAKCAVSMSTNGSARSRTWWSELGRVLARNPNSRVDFHIDGLADTNSFYRRNTSFDKIINNAKAFIEAGGRANWEFIPFKHNEHQLEEARSLSIDLDFARFTVKKSNWPFTKDLQKIPFTTRSGEQYYLEAPSAEHIPKPSRNRLSMEFLSTTTDDIQCLAKKKKEIFISCEGIVYPCCWTARFARNIYLGRQTKDGFSTIFKHHDGREIFDLRNSTLEQALQSNFFADLAEQWTLKRPPVCYRKCGKKDQPEKVKTNNSRR